MKFLPVALKGAILTSVVMTLVACGGASFGSKDSNKRSADSSDKLAGSVDDCYSLGGKPNHPGQQPGQHPGQVPGYDSDYDAGYDSDYDVPTYDPKDDGKGGYDEPVVYDDETTYKKPCGGGKPGQHPGQNPDWDDDCKDDCDNYKPVDTDPGYEPKPWPTQQPGKPDTCGKDGKYCDNGHGPGQWPGQSVGGGSYDKHDVEACMGAFRSHGYDTKGQWGIKVLEQKSVNVLGHSIVEDHGREHSIVLIKTVGVLGSTEFRLLNPNALYCIKNVSVMAETRVMSCLQSNVVWGKDVNVLSAAKSKVVDCK
jgi:hypothetical protein